MSPYYYNVPTQVQFLDEMNNFSAWKGGIAYKDEIIDGKSGVVIKISDIYNMALDEGMTTPPIVDLIWLDISDEIIDM